ncbi:P-loop containing nucleoside triphosphate hydrolase protein [Ramaria rubella]|nr:P-loop containing nucleoside triphosphate hydrolase protein [Ramaria rubella]
MPLRDSEADRPYTATDNERVVLLLVGLIGSGKSTFAEALQTFFPHFRRCNQDDLGDRRRVESLAEHSLAQGLSVCIDRTNFDERQRQHFINIAQKFPDTVVWALVFDTPYEICASRIRLRTNHPTIKTPELGLKVLERFSADYVPPTIQEGFDRIKLLKPHPTGAYTRDEVAAILDDIRNSSSPYPPMRPAAPLHGLQFFRDGYGRSDRSVSGNNGGTAALPRAIPGKLSTGPGLGFPGPLPPVVTGLWLWLGYVGRRLEVPRVTI